MSWINRRPLLACALLAFGVRAGLALVTERVPLFPPHYYSDAAIVDLAAWRVAEARAAGAPYSLPGSPSRRVQVVLLSRAYSVLGHRPLAAKLLAAAAGAASLALLGAVAARAVGPAAGVALALFAALWPSNAFFSSQNFKDPYVWLCVYLAWWAAFALSGGESRRGLRGGLAAAAVLWGSLTAVGLLRGYLMTVLLATLAAYAGAALFVHWRRGRPWVLPALCLLTVVAAKLSFHPLAMGLMDKTLGAPVREGGDLISEWDLIPSTFDHDRKAFVRPFSPEGISRTRKLRQAADRDWALRFHRRGIGTQIFPDAEFHDWGDIARFLPRGLAYALLMPLPGLYPLEGNLGRALASVENLALLGLLLAAAAGFRKGPRRLEGWALAGFFLAVALGSALLEFDLGSAARHKSLYLPFALAFAWPLLSAARPPLESPRGVD